MYIHEREIYGNLQLKLYFYLNDVLLENLNNIILMGSSKQKKVKMKFKQIEINKNGKTIICFSCCFNLFINNNC